MYTGNENLINDGSHMPYTMQNFWQWGYSNLLQNMQRGTFAEFIVHCALLEGGIDTAEERNTTTQPYDLDGPIVPATGKKSRLEVKCAAFVQLWDIKHPDRANFTIRPAVMPDEDGDFKDDAPRQRNNDIYVFCVYTATTKTANILDLSWWEFYVVPTYKIDTDPHLKTQKTISLTSVRELTTPVSFSSLCNTIKSSCDEIPAEYEKYREWPNQTKRRKTEE